MIEIKKLDTKKYNDMLYRNRFLFLVDIQAIDERYSRIFYQLLNTIIEYQKNDYKFISLYDLSLKLKDDLLRIKNEEISDFFDLILLMFYFFDKDFLVSLRDYKVKLNKYISELSELTLKDYINMLNHNGNYNLYLRKKKLNKLNNI